MKSSLQKEVFIKTEVYNEFELLEPIQHEWDEFVQFTGGEIFMTYDWLRIWWKYYGKNRSLKIFIVRNQSEIVGIMPIFFERIRLGPISAVCGKIVGTDFTLTTITLPINKEYLPHVLRSFWNNLDSEKWDIIHIGPLSGLYRDFANLSNCLKSQFGEKYKTKRTNKKVQTFFLLTNENGAPQEVVCKKHQARLRKKYNLLKRMLNNVSLSSNFVTNSNFEETFSAFIKLHQSHWEEQNKAGHFGDWPHSLEFHRDMALAQLKHERLRLLEIRANGEVLGYRYSYKFGNTYADLLGARNEKVDYSCVGMGKIILSEFLKKAEREKIDYIDSMRGKYEHKLWMGGRLFPINNIYIFRNKIRDYLRVNIFRTFAWLLDLCYYRIWFGRVAPKMPLKPRPLWDLWIRSSSFAG